MFALELDGLDDASARLEAYPAALAAALDAKAAELAAALVDLIQNDKLSGGVLNMRSGALRDSIAAEISADPDGLVASVGSEGDVKYAAIQEYGGKTGAHIRAMGRQHDARPLPRLDRTRRSPTLHRLGRHRRGRAGQSKDRRHQAQGGISDQRRLGCHARLFGLSIRRGSQFSMALDKSAAPISIMTASASRLRSLPSPTARPSARPRTRK
jgi:hypothetical protein